MPIDNAKEAFIAKAREAIERAQQETDLLSLSVPSPVRDLFFDSIMKELMEEPHNVAHCQGCLQGALSMALSTLGWVDQHAPRPASPEERMGALTEQMTIALRFLDKLHKQGLHGDR